MGRISSWNPRGTAQLISELDRKSANLRDGRRGRKEMRASDDERPAGLRRLELHRDTGQMSAEEHEQRQRST